MSPSAATRPATFRQVTGRWWPAGLIVLLGVWTYWPALHGGWVWDDQIDLAGNAVIHDPAGWWKIWLQPAGWHFFPLKSTVQWLQWQLWQDQTVGYHVTNLVLHLLSALLLWRVLARLGAGGGAWIGGLLFAVHPLAVESVAWIAELKNTLSLPLLLLAALAWLDWDEGGRRRDYARALGWFGAAMLAKTSVVMFPAVLLLHAWWKHRRIDGRAVAATLPFFVVSLGLGLVTVRFEHQPATALLALPELGFGSRLAGAGGALAFYLEKFLWPVGLSPVYPEWRLAAPAWWLYLPWAGLLAGGVVCWLKRTTWGRAAGFGLGFVVLNLAPILGFVPMAYHHISWVADHFAYVSLAGLAGLAAAGAALLPSRAATVGGMLVALVLAAVSHRHAAAFASEEALWSHAIRQQPDAWLAHHDLAHLLARTARPAEAIAHYETALRLKPENSEGWNNLGNLLLGQSRLAEAVTHYEKAVALQPRYPQAWANLGNALALAGRDADAAVACARALQVDPGHAAAHATLAELALRAGRLDEADRHYAAACAARPGDAVLCHNRGSVLLQLGRAAEAQAQYEAALRLEPGYTEARVNLGHALLASGRAAEAVAQWREALRRDAAAVGAQVALGNHFVQSGRPAEAQVQFEAALRLRPDDAGLHNNLAFALAQLGRIDEAVRECERALQLEPGYAGARENLARLRALQPAGR